ncbi:hypothetical protein HYALB_00008578 [Hymenoscyphus albidus]|uniref:Uncharacterized protein n=1 Tax=Hymenoscyphus albidus TaxID=595503 RepID=A0A9N9LF19_9HELO|nr:hypothetical protein HYALB_00008578 [Hymenoscyphus albidus]
MALLDSFKQTTPPASISPLTPPSTADAKFLARVAAILRAFKSCQNGYPPSVPWTVYKLNSGEYEDLQRRLKDDVELWGYVDNRVRYDYDPISSTLIIRMTTTLHDTFAAELVTKIKEEFENLKKD